MRHSWMSKKGCSRLQQDGCRLVESPAWALSARLKKRESLLRTAEPVHAGSRCPRTGYVNLMNLDGRGLHLEPAVALVRLPSWRLRPEAGDSLWTASEEQAAADSARSPDVETI